MARKFNKDYWRKETHDWYVLPYVQHTPKNNVSTNDQDQSALRYCPKCDTTYEALWMGGRYKYYKLYLYPYLPKEQKVLVCPRCKGKKVKEAMES
jgi:Zn finger protein HypA/HybF involved in hydrogenase expression